MFMIMIIIYYNLSQHSGVERRVDEAQKGRSGNLILRLPSFFPACRRFSISVKCRDVDWMYPVLLHHVPITLFSLDPEGRGKKKKTSSLFNGFFFVVIPWNL